MNSLKYNWITVGEMKKGKIKKGRDKDKDKNLNSLKNNLITVGGEVAVSKVNAVGHGHNLDHHYDDYDMYNNDYDANNYDFDDYDMSTND